MPITAFPTMMNIIARGSNRIFVGASLCKSDVIWLFVWHMVIPWPGRNKEFLEISADFAKDVMKGGTVLTFVPKALQP